jgi:invasion protein IalB
MYKYVCGLTSALVFFASISMSHAQSGDADTAVKISKFADWSVRCVKSEKTVCRTFQRLYVNRDGKRVIWAAISIGKDDIRIRGPLGVALDASATIGVAGHKETIPFAFCLRSGCSAAGPLSDELLNLFKKQDAATISFRHRNGREMQAQVSLNGFSRAAIAMLEQSE